VHKVQNIATGEILAAKCVRMEHPEEGVPGTALREICLMRDLDSPYILKLNKVAHADGIL
jgi:hypothetical protein